MAEMKHDWNERAKENARYYIATTQFDSEELFADSGRRDVDAFWSDLEHLLTPAATLVDIGCGIGRMDAWLAPRVARLIGVDVSGEMVRQARARLAHLHNVEFVEGDGRSLAVLPDASADLVMSHIVFQHMPRDCFEDYVRDVPRVLRPGGHFVFQLPESNPHTPADPPESDSFEMRFYSVDQARQILERHGLHWEGVKKFAVTGATIEFNQLRICARRP